MKKKRRENLEKGKKPKPNPQPRQPSNQTSPFRPTLPRSAQRPLPQPSAHRLPPLGQPSTVTPPSPALGPLRARDPSEPPAPPASVPRPSPPQLLPTLARLSAPSSPPRSSRRVTTEIPGELPSGARTPRSQPRPFNHPRRTPCAPNHTSAATVTLARLACAAPPCATPLRHRGHAAPPPPSHCEPPQQPRLNARILT